MLATSAIAVASSLFAGHVPGPLVVGRRRRPRLDPPGRPERLARRRPPAGDHDGLGMGRRSGSSTSWSGTCPGPGASRPRWPGVMVATAVAVAAYGLYQIPVEFAQLRDAVPDAARGGPDPDGDRARARRRRTAFEKRLLDSNEPFSTFALANSLAGFLVGPMALAFAVALENLKREGRGSRLVALAMAAVPGLIMLVCLVLTKSRSAYDRPVRRAPGAGLAGSPGLAARGPGLLGDRPGRAGRGPGRGGRGDQAARRPGDHRVDRSRSATAGNTGWGPGE